ncbi:GntR family transcriptional regulator [Brevibacillus borstelensis]|uniref:GntR family transcriptional regulator n=1 Tax=Brevibacillus borstelensis TaxID=45462 RepID=UPI0030BB619D
MPENATRLQRTFMRDEVYNILREWIMIGKLEPGTKLRDKDLSETLGISRTPIREALIRLEDEGLVVTKANRWTMVSPIDFDGAENIYSIVWTLECLALTQGFHNISPKDTEEMEKMNENLKQAMENGDRLAALEADNLFHKRIIDLSQNHELAKLLPGLKVKIQRLELHYFKRINDGHLSYLEHQKIIDAFKNKNLPQALEALEENWKKTLGRVRQN